MEFQASLFSSFPSTTLAINSGPFTSPSFSPLLSVQCIIISDLTHDDNQVGLKLQLPGPWLCSIDQKFVNSNYFSFVLVFVFKASSSNCVYQRDKVCENNTEVLSATFFPMPRSMESESANASVQWLCHSSLYFFTSAQVQLYYGVPFNQITPVSNRVISVDLRKSSLRITFCSSNVYSISKTVFNHSLFSV